MSFLTSTSHQLEQVSVDPLKTNYKKQKTPSLWKGFFCVDIYLFDMEMRLTEILHELQYKEFCNFVNENKLDSENSILKEFVIPSRLKKIWSFLTELKDLVKVKLTDMVKLFMNKLVFKFFAKIKFSMKYLFGLVKKGFKAYKEVIKAIGEYVASTKVGKWTEEKLKDLDAFLAKHPKTKRMAGFAVAGILIYIWLNMTFTGNADYDFDMADMLLALAGGFTLSTLFAGPDGMALLMLFATGVIGLSFPWPGPQSFQFVGAVLYGSAKLVGQKLRKDK
tara:strand:+ start:412 stop:1245 length:834 start_codon:yes stop_codon:yes gene_type:complete